MVWNKQKQTQKKEPSQENRDLIIQKKQKQSSTLNAIATTAQNTTPLTVPTNNPHQNDISTPIEDNNSPIVVNGVEIPSLCADINRKDTLEKALEFLTRTKIGDEPTEHPVPNGASAFTTEKHRACVCVICDSFIIGTKEIGGYQKKQLKVNQAI